MSILETLGNEITGTPLRFTVPSQLREIDLLEEPTSRIRRTLQDLVRRIPNISPEDRIAATYTQERLISRLTQEGAVYVAQCVARSDSNPAKLCLAQFSILVKEAKLGGKQPLHTIARGLRTPGEPREVAFVEFPAGEGLVIGEERRVETTATVTGHLRTATHIVRQAQILLPFPDRRRLAIIGVSTECLEDWYTLTQILNNIAHTVSFSEEEENSISARLGTLV